MTDLVAQYWTKPITRREAQAVFDDLSSAVNSSRLCEPVCLRLA
jgi:hypothetical protein